MFLRLTNLANRKSSDWFQIVRVFSSIMERMGKRLKVSEEMYMNLNVDSLRLEVKNLSSVVYTEQPSKPPPIEKSAEPTTQAPVKIIDSFVSCVIASVTVSVNF